MYLKDRLLQHSIILDSIILEINAKNIVNGSFRFFLICRFLLLSFSPVFGTTNKHKGRGREFFEDLYICMYVCIAKREVFAIVFVQLINKGFYTR